MQNKRRLSQNTYKAKFPEVPEGKKGPKISLRIKVGFIPTTYSTSSQTLAYPGLLSATQEAQIQVTHNTQGNGLNRYKTGHANFTGATNKIGLE